VIISGNLLYRRKEFVMMKKYAVLGLASLFLLTGCGKSKIECNRDMTSYGVKMNLNVVATFKGKKATNVDYVLTFENETLAKAACSKYSSAKCKGKTLTLSLDDYAKEFNAKKPDINKMTKDDFKDTFEASGFECK
jgi:hypothetical protein